VRQSFVGALAAAAFPGVLACVGMLFLLAVAAPPAPAQTAPAPERRAAELRSVPQLDLGRYAGRWYEIARLPNRFQDACACCVSATYEPRPDGRITVVNECRTRDGGLVRASGVARKAREDGPASRLKVRFAPGFLSFLPFVWGDYWVVDIASDYTHALVGSPDRRYLWILSRQPTLPDAAYEPIVGLARDQGFETDRLLLTPQIQVPADR
jgi:apolipoprotein D and lipocalin family protein